MAVASVFSGTISLGTGLVMLVMLAVAGFFATRGKLTEQANARAKDWRDDYMAERARADDNHKRYLAEREVKHTLKTELAAMELRTDLSVVMEALAATNKSLMRSNETLEEFHRDFSAREVLFHELRQQIQNTEERLTVGMDAIVTRLNGGPH